AMRYRNIGGPHHAGGKIIRTGETFVPDARALEKFPGKFVPVTDGPGRLVAGADIGLRTLRWGSDAAMRRAMDAGLTVEEMQAVGSSGAGGFIAADVRRALEARARAGKAGKGSSGPGADPGRG